jgi:putative SOS response-associated peptidase YedK
MCGRYLFKQNDDEELNEWIETLAKNGQDTSALATHEVFPSNQTITFVGNLDPQVMIWGIPKWDNKGILINARTETATRSVFFQEHLKQRRCVIKVDGFYEWNKDKQKCLVQDDHTEALYLAAFYDDQPIPHFVILTMDANQSFKALHDRQPLLIKKDDIKQYIEDGYVNLPDFTQRKSNQLIWSNIDHQTTLF